MSAFIASRVGRSWAAMSRNGREAGERSASWDRTATRQTVTVVGAVAQAALPLVLLPRVRRELEPPNVIQPAPYAFTIWLPTYLASLGYAGYQARPGGRDQRLLTDVGWPLAGAFVSGSVWAPLVYFRRYWAAQTALFGIAGFSEVARRRVVRAARDNRMSSTESWVVTPPAVLLAGWGAAAAAVNLAAMLADPTAPQQRNPALGVAGLLGLSAYGGYATRAASGARTPASAGYAATLLWALAGIVVGQRRRSRPAAVAAAIAAIPVIAAAARPRRTE